MIICVYGSSLSPLHTRPSPPRQVPPTDGVIRSYRRCLPLSHKSNTQFKSFVNTAFQPTMYSPHRAVFGVNNSHAYTVNESFERVASGRHRNATHVRAAVYHYVVKSKQDFEMKMRRGGGAGVTRTRAYMTTLDKQCNETCSEATYTYEKACGGEHIGGADPERKPHVTIIQMPTRS